MKKIVIIGAAVVAFPIAGAALAAIAVCNAAGRLVLEPVAWLVDRA